MDQHQCEEFWVGAWRTYAELDWDREEFTTNLFRNGIATNNAWKIDECRFYDALLPLYCLYKAFGEAKTIRL